MNNIDIFKLIEKDLTSRYLIDLNNASKMSNLHEREAKLEKVEDYYEFHIEKMELLPQFATINQKLQKTFHELFSLIYGMDIPFRSEMLLTLAVAMVQLKDDLSLSSSNWLTLCNGTLSLPLSDYPIYGPIIGNKDLLDHIQARTADLDVSASIFDAVLEYCDYNVDMDTDYTRAVSDCLKVVNGFPVPEKRR